MGLLHLFADLASAAAEGIGTHQAQQQAQQQTSARGRRAIRANKTCTPCAAMADVDNHRRKLGFTTGGKK